MKHVSVVKQINALGLIPSSVVYTWIINDVKYSEMRHTASRGNIDVYWVERNDGSCTHPIITDRTDPSDPRCDYSGKVSNIHKISRLASTFKLFEATTGCDAFKLAGNVAGLIQIK